MRHAPTRLVLVVAVALVDERRRVLVTRRPKGKSMAGLWEFPGGKVEAGERPEQALAREIAEELALGLEESALEPLTFASHAYPDFHLLMPLFLARSWTGSPEPREGQEIAWADPQRLFELAMPPADAPLLPALAARLAGEPGIDQGGLR